MNLRTEHFLKSKLSNEVAGVTLFLDFIRLESADTVDFQRYFENNNRNDLVGVYEYYEIVFQTRNNLVIAYGESLLSIKLLKGLSSDPNPVYLNYYIKDWIFRTISVTEIVYVLMNRVCKLGFSGGEETVKNINTKMRAVWPESKPLLKKLISFREQPFLPNIGLRDANNQIKHAGEFGHNHIVTLLDQSQFVDFGFIDENDFQIDTYKLICDSSKELEKLSDSLYPIVIECLDFLASEFTKNISALLDYRG